MHVASDTHDLFDALADALLTSAADAVLNRGTFHLALSGGSTPEPFYVHLVIDPRYRLIPWKQTHLPRTHFPSDEHRLGQPTTAVAQSLPVWNSSHIHRPCWQEP